MILAATGHRPDKIRIGNEAIIPELREFAGRCIVRREPELVISGMAQGWDTAVALACIHLNIPFVAAIPFRGQEKIWPPTAQMLYRDLLSEAAEVVVVAKHSLNIAFQERNEYMVDRCDSLLALWNGTPGGTSNAVRYAQGWKPVENVWDEWQRFRERADENS